METLNAIIKSEGDQYFIKIETLEGDINIPISEDNPHEVKKAFNKIITLVKKKNFQVILNSVNEDLYSLVANEYVIQLNREIQEIRGVMEDYGLIQQTQV